MNTIKETNETSHTGHDENSLAGSDNLPRIPNTFEEYILMQDQEADLTPKIFALTAPYDNPYQGDKCRILFVCSAGLLRSPTGAHVGAKRGYNTRAAGSSVNYALIPVSVNLLEWAHRIVFVNKENFDEVFRMFGPVGYEDDLLRKSIVLDIPDHYHAFDEKLVAIFDSMFDEREADFKVE